MSVKIEIAGGKSQFHPGESLEGTASWTGSGEAAVEIQLSWRTEGKGTQDTRIVESVPLGNAAGGDRVPFTVTVPAGPYSFSGKLISLVWGIEAVTNRNARSDRVRVTISPTGSEILLHRK